MNQHGTLERFWELVVAFGAKLGVESFFHNLRKEGATAVVTAVKKKLNDEVRAELMAFLMVELAAYSKRASANLLRRQRKCNAKPGGDDMFITLLGKLYLSLSDTERKKAIRLESFKILGCMKEKDFWSALEGLNHDWVMRLIHRLPEVTEAMIKEFTKALKKLGVFEALQKADGFVSEKLKGINDDIEKHWWVRLARKKSLVRELALIALLLIPVLILLTL